MGVTHANAAARRLLCAVRICTLFHAMAIESHSIRNMWLCASEWPIRLESGIAELNLAFVELGTGKRFLRGISKSYPDAGASAWQGNVRFAKK